MIGFLPHNPGFGSNHTDSLATEKVELVEQINADLSGAEIPNESITLAVHSKLVLSHWSQMLLAPSFWLLSLATMSPSTSREQK